MAGVRVAFALQVITVGQARKCIISVVSLSRKQGQGQERFLFFEQGALPRGGNTWVDGSFLESILGKDLVCLRNLERHGVQQGRGKKAHRTGSRKVGKGWDAE